MARLEVGLHDELPLKRILRGQGRTQRWFAEQVPMHESLLSKILLGQRPASPAFIARASQILQLPPEVLFERAALVPTGTETEHAGRDAA